MSVASSVLEDILCEARAAGASDVHLAAGMPPMMRVRGELSVMEFSRLLPADTLDILLSVMPEVARDRFEERGEYAFSFYISGCGRCRANVYKEKGNVALALRLVYTEIPSAEELGLPESVTELYKLKRGLVLVAGASGSGRSTTLAAIVDRINSLRSTHIITLENPVEYLHPHKMSMVNQREIGVDSVDYASALYAALREDPDVILVGELDGQEVISAAITAAEMGHLVLSAVPVTRVADVIERIIDRFSPNQQPQIRVRLANVLEAVVAQELVPSEDGGRRASFEVLRVSSEVRDMIREERFFLLSGMLQS